MSQVAPQAFSPAWVIRITLSVWRRDALPLTLVAVLFSAPLVPIVLAVGDTSRAYFLANGLIGLFTSGALCAGVVTDLRGARPRVGEMLAVALLRSGSLLLASLVSGLLIVLGLLLLVVPGAILWAGLFVTVPVLAAESNRGAGQALRRSWELTRGRRLPVFAVALASLLPSIIGVVFAIFVGELVFGGSRIGSAILELLLAPIFGVTLSVPGIAYHALCVEREGSPATREKHATRPAGSPGRLP